MTTLEEIQDRADKATEGPWETIQADEEETTTWLESPYGDVLNHDTRGSGHLREDFTWMKRSDAEFIAHAREDVPRLVAALKAVEAALTEEAAELGKTSRRLNQQVIDRHPDRDGATAARYDAYAAHATHAAKMVRDTIRGALGS